ncbi:mycothiol transferase [Labedella endophytica]|uniref:DUF664 domain-containing protein n=1 Tax=Labedella endophytica TaxID=1523160 RepID=A0A3S0VG33_9MICO|nr:DUF664 domain-containing protein [Labedella endophytica]RUR00857.1 DUF664 domain-containing protein [Labedella endophytica]
MASTRDLLIDAFDRIRDSTARIVDGLSDEDLTFRASPEANSIAWLVWHLTRVQDDHVADAAGTDQVWTSGGFAAQFGLPFDEDATGYGMSPEEVGDVAGVSAEDLASYHSAVHDRTVAYVAGLSDSELDRVVDEGWYPPVTLAVRLVSVVSDDLQHVGQAAFVRGLLQH